MSSRKENERMDGEGEGEDVYQFNDSFDYNEPSKKFGGVHNEQRSSSDTFLAEKAKGKVEKKPDAGSLDSSETGSLWDTAARDLNQDAGALLQLANQLENSTPGRHIADSAERGREPSPAPMKSERDPVAPPASDTCKGTECKFSQSVPYPIDNEKEERAKMDCSCSKPSPAQVDQASQTFKTTSQPNDFLDSDPVTSLYGKSDVLSSAGTSGKYADYSSSYGGTYKGETSMGSEGGRSPSPYPMESRREAYTGPTSLHSDPYGRSDGIQNVDGSSGMYGPGSAYSGPTGTYGGPGGAYGGPGSDYSRPDGPYGGPAGPYGGLETPYGGPAGTYGGPSGPYATPGNAYGGPSGPYAGPGGVYNGPGGAYGGPGGAYSGPGGAYGGAGDPYGTPYGAPGSPYADYGSVGTPGGPVGYGAPQGHYGGPDGVYGPGPVGPDGTYIGSGSPYGGPDDGSYRAPRYGAFGPRQYRHPPTVVDDDEYYSADDSDDEPQDNRNIRRYNQPKSGTSERSGPSGSDSNYVNMRILPPKTANGPLVLEATAHNISDQQSQEIYTILKLLADLIKRLTNTTVDPEIIIKQRSKEQMAMMGGEEDPNTFARLKRLSPENNQKEFQYALDGPVRDDSTRHAGPGGVGPHPTVDGQGGRDQPRMDNMQQMQTIGALSLMGRYLENQPGMYNAEEAGSRPGLAGAAYPSEMYGTSGQPRMHGDTSRGGLPYAQSSGGQPQFLSTIHGLDSYGAVDGESNINPASSARRGPPVPCPRACGKDTVPKPCYSSCPGPCNIAEALANENVRSKTKPCLSPHLMRKVVCRIHQILARINSRVNATCRGSLVAETNELLRCYAGASEDDTPTPNKCRDDCKGPCSMKGGEQFQADDSTKLDNLKATEGGEAEGEGEGILDRNEADRESALAKSSMDADKENQNNAAPNENDERLGSRTEDPGENNEKETSEDAKEHKASSEEQDDKTDGAGKGEDEERKADEEGKGEEEKEKSDEGKDGEDRKDEDKKEDERKGDEDKKGDGNGQEKEIEGGGDKKDSISKSSRSEDDRCDPTCTAACAEINKLSCDSMDESTGDQIQESSQKQTCCAQALIQAAESGDCSRCPFFISVIANLLANQVNIAVNSPNFLDKKGGPKNKGKPGKGRNAVCTCDTTESSQSQASISDEMGPCGDDCTCESIETLTSSKNKSPRTKSKASDFDGICDCDCDSMDTPQKSAKSRTSNACTCDSTETKSTPKHGALAKSAREPSPCGKQCICGSSDTPFSSSPSKSSRSKTHTTSNSSKFDGGCTCRCESADTPTSSRSKSNSRTTTNTSEFANCTCHCESADGTESSRSKSRSRTTTNTNEFDANCTCHCESNDSPTSSRSKTKSRTTTNTSEFANCTCHCESTSNRSASRSTSKSKTHTTDMSCDCVCDSAETPTTTQQKNSLAKSRGKMSASSNRCECTCTSETPCSTTKTSRSKSKSSKSKSDTFDECGNTCICESSETRSSKKKKSSRSKSHSSSSRSRSRSKETCESIDDESCCDRSLSSSRQKSRSGGDSAGVCTCDDATESVCSQETDDACIGTGTTASSTISKSNEIGECTCEDQDSCSKTISVSTKSKENAECDCCHCRALKRCQQLAKTPCSQVEQTGDTLANDNKNLKAFIDSLLFDLEAMNNARNTSRPKIYKVSTLRSIMPMDNSFPVTILDVKELGVSSLYMKWTIHDCFNIAGYEIYVDGLLTNRYFNAKHETAVICDVCPANPHEICLVAQPKCKEDLSKCRKWLPSVFKYEPACAAPPLTSQCC